MKFALAMLGGVAAARVSSQESPVTRVVALLDGLRQEIEADGKTEQASYDKYACWCEDTTARKVATISKARTDIEDLSSKIVSLKGKIATLAADIKQAEADIAANIEAQKEATALRKKEHGEYAAARVEAEQAHGALDGAIKVLSGAGEGKGEASLVAMRQASVLSIVSGVKSALRSLPRDSLSEEDMQALEAFLANPTGAKKNAAFLQASNNPFGDYAPASTQIQGILKDMFDTFAGDLQEMNTNEGTAQKAFEELIATKQEELDALEATLSNKKASHGKAVKDEADSQSLRDETTELLKAAEAFLAETKKNCATKADEWATRTRLRTEELGGIMKAKEILSSGEDIFKESATTFVQLSNTARGVKISKALSKVRSMATHSKSLRLASLGVKIRLAAEAMSGTGNAAFKQVLEAIDAMIVELRKEGQDDIDHRDRCQRSLNGNANENEDLATRISKLATEIKRLNGVKTQLQTDITTTEGEIEGVEGDMKTALDLRNEEHAAHQKATKADREAVSLLTKAIAALAKFYSSNKIALTQEDPEYTTSEDDAPETTFKDANYGGRKSENTGIVAILEMIKEDVEKEMKVAASEEAEALAAYTEEAQAMQDSHDALSEKKANLESQEAETADTIADKESEKAATEGNKGASEDEKKALEESCAWVDTHFDTRAEKRKNEIAGLQDAKSFLMGSEF